MIVPLVVDSTTISWTLDPQLFSKEILLISLRLFSCKRQECGKGILVLFSNLSHVSEHLKGHDVSNFLNMSSTYMTLVGRRNRYHDNRI